MYMTEIEILQEVSSKVPGFCLGVLEMKVVVEPSGEVLLELIKGRVAELEGSMSVEAITDYKAIKGSKTGYRLLGADPSRYRLSADSLVRRVVKGSGLYYVNNVVDLLNYQSIGTGYSICGYDVKSIYGKVTLGVGEADEAYVGIGRGNLNITNMPVFRDDFGPFGTPTSDSTRTAVSKKTTSFLMIYVAFDGGADLPQILEETKTLYEKYCFATEVNTRILK